MTVPLVLDWTSNLFLLHVYVYTHVTYQSSVSKGIIENNVINICFIQVWLIMAFY